MAGSSDVTGFPHRYHRSPYRLALQPALLSLAAGWLGLIQTKGLSKMMWMNDGLGCRVRRLVTGVMVSAMVLTLGATLSACGGLASDSPASNGQPLAPVPVVAALVGAAAGTLYDKSFVSFMTTDLAPAVNWYAMYHFNTTSADIIPILYSGSVTSNAGQIREFGSFRTIRSASVSSSETSAGIFRVIISGVNTPDDRAIALSSSAVVTSADASGNWVGAWTDNLNTAISKPATLRFDQGIAATVTFGGCERQLRLLSTGAANSPYFSVTVDISAQTGCPRTPGAEAAALSGVAFVIPSLTEGKTKRLMLMVVDRTGSGFSFVGDQ